jgi:3-oxoacyl-ACP reductase-like protein
MSIFSQVLHKIFGTKPAQAPQAAPASTPAGAAPAGAPKPAAATAAPPASAAAPAQTVDVARVLDDLAAKNSQKLEWRTSIVDMLKLLDIDSSLQARKELAAELHYTGDTNDSAAMNIWLHKQVIQKLAQNGGKVPADLAD